MKTNNPKRLSRSNWYTHKGSALVLAIVSLAVAYALILHAIDTGSLQQYGIILVLAAFAINRIHYCLSRKSAGAHQ